MRIIVKMIVVVAMTAGVQGCWFDHYIMHKGDPFNINLDPKCRVPCTEESLPINHDPTSGVDSKKYEKKLRKACEERRMLCVEAIDRGIKDGDIK
jgi:hypothetical protein